MTIGSAKDHMRFRPIQCLLLAAIASWACGVSQHLHDQVEQARMARTLAWLKAHYHHAPGQGSPDRPQPGSHDREGCATCQLLAHLTAEIVAPPPWVCEHLPSVCDAIPSDRQAPIVPFHSASAIRGPPAFVHTFCAA